MRIGPGPVFAVECVHAARRWQTYSLRAGVVLVLFAALALVWVSFYDTHRGPMSFKDYAEVGESFYYAVIGTQLALVLLAAPGAAAGAVCVDKARGNLLLLLTTDLHSREIVLGKLASRVLPVAGLIVASAPVLFIASWLGGLDIEAVAAAYAVMFGSGLLGCSLALLLSVWGRKTHEVLLMTYLIEVAWLMAYPVWGMLDAAVLNTGWAAAPLRNFNPYVLAFAPYTRARVIDWGDYLFFLAAAAALAAAFAGLAVLSVRPCALRDGAVVAKARPVKRKPRDRWLLSAQPMLWYERHRRQPSRWSRAVWGLFLLGSGGGTVGGLFALLVSGRTIGEVLIPVNMLQVSVGTLLVLVGAVTALADERVRGGLDILLTTPVPTGQIVRAKWRAAFRPVPWLAVLPTAAVAAMALANGEAGAWVPVVLFVPLFMAYGAFAVSFGLFVAVAISRVGRAIAVTVGAYAVQCLGLPLMLLLLTVNASGGGGDKFGPTLVSPFFGGIAMTVHAMQWDRTGAVNKHIETMVWAIGWTLLLAFAALFFYLVALVAFDNRLGRVPDAGLKRRIAPRMKPDAPARGTARALAGASGSIDAL